MDHVDTWHHGLVARWWAEFNVDGPEIDYFRGLIAAHGVPALDAGCGTGRLLIPLLRDGIDVDGVDVSDHMLALCRERAEREGLAPRLLAQPLHALELPRRYRTIFVCGSFGFGGEPTLDARAIVRFRGALQAGGVLAIDLPDATDRARWQAWAERALPRMPNPWPDTGEQQVAADGTVLEMRSRISNVDPVGRVLMMQIRVRIRRNGALVDEEEYTLRHSVYSEGQLIALLVAAGCDDVHAVDGYQAAGAIGSGNAEGVVRVVLASAESSAAFDRR